MLEKAKNELDQLIINDEDLSRLMDLGNLKELLSSNILVYILVCIIRKAIRYSMRGWVSVLIEET